MDVKKIVESTVKQFLSEQFTVANKEEFNDALLDLTTLDMEDEQVRYTKTANRKLTHLFGGNNYDLYLIDRKSLPSSGPFEISILDNDNETIGFIRGTKSNKVISFNLIHIQSDFRGDGIGTDIYEQFLKDGFIFKSDDEITDATYSMYDRLIRYGYTPLIFNDGRVGVKK